MKVYVYRNLHRNCLSVRSKGKVVAHVDEIALTNVKFKVSQKGRERVLREKQKNVHAGVEGFWLKDHIGNKENLPTRIVYDPYKYDTFVYADTLQPCLESEFALVTISGAFTHDKAPCS